MNQPHTQLNPHQNLLTLYNYPVSRVPLWTGKLLTPQNNDPTKLRAYLVETTREVDHDFPGSMVINDLEFSDVTCKQG